MAKKHQELIAREGWPFLVPFVVLFLLSLALGGPLYLTISALALALFTAYFFRNPYRQIPSHRDAVVSPADGKVVAIRKLADGRKHVSIFLNIFNVHVNRCPIEGTVEKVQFTPGQYLAAYKDEASSLNERNQVTIRDKNFEVEVIQIAGLIARRIICWVDQNDKVTKGERFGLIRFGSRVDLILPASCQVVVTTGQKVSGGSDIIAKRTY